MYIDIFVKLGVRRFSHWFVYLSLKQSGRHTIMSALEDFKAEVDKFIHFMNERLKTYHLNTDEEYDAVIDNLVVEYYRIGNRALVFGDVEWYEETLDEHDGKNPYSMIHCYDGAWAGEQRDNSYPREHTCFAHSSDSKYNATITTIIVGARPPSGYVYRELLSKTNLYIPQFFLEYIEDTVTDDYHYVCDP